MASETLSDTNRERPTSRRAILSGRAQRNLRENLTAYLFLAPALFIIFTFGIFPILYAGYVSLYKWRIRQNEYLGLDNYVGAMGDPAYMFIAIVGLLLVVTGVRNVLAAYRAGRERTQTLPRFLPYLLPAGLVAYGLVLIILRAITFFAMEQAIAAGEASRLGNVGLGLLIIVVGGLLSVGLHRLQQRNVTSEKFILLPNPTVALVGFCLTVGLGIALLYYTYVELSESERYARALARNITLILALVPFIIGYFVWTWGSKHHDNRVLIAAMLVAAALIGVGVWLLTRDWSYVSGDADGDFYLSLLVTVFYSAMTVPVQLAISIALAYLLYQPIRAKGLLRVVYFVPYIAPTVATAGIFQGLFTTRETGIANTVVTGLGGAKLDWLQESGAAIAEIARSFGLTGFTAASFGPSLALVVVALYSIWVFVGYDTVIFLAGLGNISNTLYEAAKIDGAGRWQIFRFITLPLLSPTTYFLSVISIIGTFKAFNHIWVLRLPAQQGTIDTASVHFFSTFFRGARFGYSTSMAMVLFVIILALTLIQNRIASQRVFYG